jgi:uncharacterized alpha-E superfamily protein
MNHTLSRTAERVYWLGRYLERAECTARLVMVNGNLLIDLPQRRPLAWRSLVDIMGTPEHFATLYETADERSVVRYLTVDLRHTGSLLASLGAARENARTIRELMPRVTFEYINELYLQFKDALSASLSRSRVAESMELVLRRVQHLHGFLSATMIHGAAWHFLRIGQFIERADMTTRIIDVRSVDAFAEQGEDLEPFAQLQWRSVLRSLHAMQAYHLCVQQPLAQPLALEFLFKERDLPRSVSYGLSRIRGALRALPRNDKPLSAINRVVRFLEHEDVKKLEGATLHAFIDDLQLKLYELDRTIDRTYFHAQLRMRRHARAEHSADRARARPERVESDAS